MTQIAILFIELNIKCSLQINDTTRIWIQFEDDTPNLVQYADTIQYIYCEEKRIQSAPVIELLKILEKGLRKAIIP
jgi:ABC-type antimicrobial peptide transport system ATPase subunit